MDEAARRAARRRATIAFVAAGVLVVVSVVGLLAVERRHGRWDGPGTRIERRIGDVVPGGPGGRRESRPQGDDRFGEGGQRQGGQSEDGQREDGRRQGGSWDGPGADGRTGGTPGQREGGARQPSDDGSSPGQRSGGDDGGSTTTTAPAADGI